MNHCKNKGKHKWKNPYGVGLVCEVCGRTKYIPLSDINAGAFGKVNKSAGKQLNLKVVPRSKRDTKIEVKSSG